MPAQANRLIAVRQHKAEHHLNTKHQRMEIPHNRRLIQKSDPIGRRNTAKGFHALLHKEPLFGCHGIVVLIEQKRTDKGKGNVNKLLLHPLIAFCIQKIIEKSFLYNSTPLLKDVPQDILAEDDEELSAALDFADSF